MKTAWIVAPAIAFALVAPAAARAGGGHPLAGPQKPISCLTFLSQFEGNVLYRTNAPKLSEAQALAHKGREMCLEGKEPLARAYLMVALNEIGVTPRGVKGPPPVTITQEAKKPQPQNESPPARPQVF